MRRSSIFLSMPVLVAAVVAAAWGAPSGDEPAPAKPAPAAVPDRSEAEPGKPAAAKPAEPAAGAALAVSVPTFMNRTCPIMGKPSSALLYTELPQGRIYLCCAPCAKKVKKDPQRAYDAAYPTVRKAGNTTCPVTGAALKSDSPRVVVQGLEIGVASEEAKALVPLMAQIVLAKATDPLVKDVGNTTCPITGKPVAEDAFCLVGKELVHLSSPQCVEELRKDPAAALGKARADAASTKKDPAPDPAKRTGDSAQAAEPAK